MAHEAAPWRRRGVLAAGLGLGTLANLSARAQRVLPVGPTREVKTLAQAARVARDGEVIEVDAGEYVADVAIWSQPNLTLRAVGGRVRLRASGASAQNKGIWVTRCDRMEVSGFDFLEATSSDGNGAGIRHERGLLVATDCGFFLGQNGILTNNDPQCELELHRCELARNGAEDGRTHNLYAGHIGRLLVSGCWFHNARGGHLLKSRAHFNRVEYSALADDSAGSSSYELEFANGGRAEVVGCLLVQAPGTRNPHVVSFGTEGLRDGANPLLMAHNTLLDLRRQGGVFLRLRDEARVEVALWNNLFHGPGRMPEEATERQGNLRVAAEAFVNLAAGDLRPRPGGAAWNQAAGIPGVLQDALQPSRQYSHPRQLRPLTGTVRHVGASQGSRLLRGE